jgi:hypothetical protein
MRNSAGQDWMLLLKLGQREHLEAVRQGRLYMNTLSYFIELEKDEARGDPLEGTETIIQPKDIGDFYIDPNIPGMGRITITGADLAGPLRIRLNGTSACNLFCLFAITSPIDDVIFPRQYKWFGDSILLVTNTQEFLSRLERAATEQQLSGAGRLVTYYDENAYSGRTGRFMKSSRYYHQKEYRLVLETGKECPFVFNVGDLADITSEVLPFHKADELMKFGSAAARKAGLSD